MDGTHAEAGEILTTAASLEAKFQYAFTMVMVLLLGAGVWMHLVAAASTRAADSVPPSGGGRQINLYHHALHHPHLPLLPPAGLAVAASHPAGAAGARHDRGGAEAVDAWWRPRRAFAFDSRTSIRSLR